MVHCYKLGGLNIVLDTYSGSVHVVDDIAYDIIGMYEQKSTEEIVAEIRSRYPDCAEATEEEIRQVCADVETLKQQGQLFTPDTYASKATALKEKSAGVVKSIRSEEHTSELQSRYLISYAVFCLKKYKIPTYKQKKKGKTPKV